MVYSQQESFTLLTSMIEIWSLVVHNTDVAGQRQVKHFTKCAKEVTLEVGYMVYHKNHTHKQWVPK